MLGSLSKVLPRVEVPPEWGVDPVPPSERRMTFRQHFVLWFNLGIGLLVILTGALLVLPAEDHGLGMAPPAGAAGGNRRQHHWRLPAGAHGVRRCPRERAHHGTVASRLGHSRFLRAQRL